MSKRHLLSVPIALLLTGALLLAAGSGVALARRTGHGHGPRHAALVSISVTPAAPSIVEGASVQLKATGTFSDSTTADLTATAAWASSASSVTISAGGLAQGVSAGSATVSATSGLVSGGTLVTVTAAPVPVTLTSIAVTPASPSIVAGTSVQLTATGSYSDGSTADLTASVAWASSDPSATVDAAGLAQGVSAGSATISATSGLVSGSTVLTVTAAPVPADVTVLGNVQAIFANGSFLLTSGGATYTVVMSPTTSIVNLLGHIVPSQFIAVGGAVEVTGPLAAPSTISATLVVVQTTIDF